MTTTRRDDHGGDDGDDKDNKNKKKKEEDEGKWGTYSARFARDFGTNSPAWLEYRNRQCRVGAHDDHVVC
jgi:hypothetical protein